MFKFLFKRQLLAAALVLAAAFSLTTGAANAAIATKPPYPGFTEQSINGCDFWVRDHNVALGHGKFRGVVQTWVERGTPCWITSSVMTTGARLLVQGNTVKSEGGLSTAMAPGRLTYASHDSVFPPQNRPPHEPGMFYAQILGRMSSINKAGYVTIWDVGETA